MIYYLDFLYHKLYYQWWNIQYYILVFSNDCWDGETARSCTWNDLGTGSESSSAPSSCSTGVHWAKYRLRSHQAWKQHERLCRTLVRRMVAALCGRFTRTLPNHPTPPLWLAWCRWLQRLLLGHLDFFAGRLIAVMASNSGPSAVYVLDIKGKPLISRDYRGDVEATVIDKFFPLVMDAEEEEGMTWYVHLGVVDTRSHRSVYLAMIYINKFGTRLTLIEFSILQPHHSLRRMHVYVRQVWQCLPGKITVWLFYYLLLEELLAIFYLRMCWQCEHSMHGSMASGVTLYCCIQVCAATRNANVMLIFVFLHKLIEVRYITITPVLQCIHNLCCGFLSLWYTLVIVSLCRLVASSFTCVFLRLFMSVHVHVTAGIQRIL